MLWVARERGGGLIKPGPIQAMASRSPKMTGHILFYFRRGRSRI